VCGIPRHPTSTSVATTNLGDRVTCAVQRALAQIGDGIGMADGGAAIPATGAVLSGADPRHDGEPFCNEVILLGGSGPGTPHADGWLTMLTQYHHTALWAKAVHDQFAEVDGLIWTSNLCDPDAALLFFGDRVDASDLMVTGVRHGSDGSFLEDVRKAAQRANILIAL